MTCFLAVFSLYFILHSNEHLISTGFLEYQRKLRSSVCAQSQFVPSYDGTSKYSLDLVYTDCELELAGGCTEGQVPLDLEDILGPVGVQNEEADTILVSGEAGMGKSFLLQRLHLLWAKNETLRDFFLLFPFSCRKLNMEQRDLSLRELLFLHCCWPDRDQEQLFQFILDNPHLVLFTFDGLDEFKQSFSDEQRHCCPNLRAPVSTLLFNLLQGCLMKGVRKLVTSRPVAISINLKQYLRKEIRLRGFSRSGIDNFMRRHHSSDSSLPILKLLHGNTALFALCHVPVLCWIVSKCCIVHTNRESDLHTTTDIYILVLKHFLYRKDSKRHSMGSCWLQENFTTIMRLGQLALQGLESSLYLFSDSELQCKGFTGQDISIGILTQITSSLTCAEPHFEFMHITMQCFFAALYLVLNDGDHVTLKKLMKRVISWSGPDYDSNQIREAGKTEMSNYHITTRFVSGLLSQRHQVVLLQTCSTQALNTKSKQAGKNLSRGLQRYFKSMPKPVAGEKKSIHAMPGFIWLVQSIHEMQDCEVAREAVAAIEVEHLKLTYCNIGPVECTALAYVLQHLRNPVGLQLDNNAVGDVGVKELLPCLHVCHAL